MVLCFWEGGDFVEASFARTTSFSSAIFRGGGCFLGAQFSGITTFGDVRFDGGVIFTGSEFLQYSGFERAVFRGEAEFINVRFQAVLSFEDAAFYSAVSFDRSKFCGLANFRNVRLESSGDFSVESRFMPDFVGATLYPAVSFHGLNVIGLGQQALRAQLIGLSFFGLIVCGVLLLWLLRGPSAQIAGWAVIATGAGLLLAWTLYGGKWAASDCQHEASRARALMKLNVENGNHLDEARFFRHLLKAQRLGSPLGARDAVVRLFEKPLGMLYEIGSDYGLSFLRPLIILVNVILFNGFLLWAWEGGGLNPQLKEEYSEFWRVRSPDLAKPFHADLLEAIGYSTSRAFPFGPWGEINPPTNQSQYDRPTSGEACSFAARMLAVGACRPNGIVLDTASALEGHRLIVRTLGLLQSLLTIVLAFLFGLAVRRRFQIS